MDRTLDGVGIPMEKLAGSLSRSDLHRSIIDKTRLTGSYDVHLKWAVDAAAGATPAGAAPPVANEAGPSIFKALREQLGLRLESAKGPVEVLVIDHVEKPSAN